ncbi:MAG: hypothetical protein V1495_07135 [Pseudomonadota bacterium]
MKRFRRFLALGLALLSVAPNLLGAELGWLKPDAISIKTYLH